MTQDLDWTGVARLRQGLYRLFGAGLLRPDEDRIEGLLAGADLLDESGIENFAFASPWAKLMLTLSDLPPVPELVAEYVRLFSVGTGYTPCPPYESHYLGGRQDGETAVIVGALERTYRALGFALTPGVSHPPDHVATELEVLSALCGAEYVAWQEGALGEVARVQEAELDLLEEHLGNWFHLFATQVGECSTQSFYTDLAAAGAAFVHHDRELLRAVTHSNRDLEVT